MLSEQILITSIMEQLCKRQERGWGRMELGWTGLTAQLGLLGAGTAQAMAPGLSCRGVCHPPRLMGILLREWRRRRGSIGF